MIELKIILCDGFDDVLTKFEDIEMLVIQMENEADFEDYFKIKECIMKNSNSDVFKKIRKKYNEYLEGR